MSGLREIKRINERELALGLEKKASWHDDFRDSAYIFVGGLPFELNEGDVLTIFSQFGEPIDIDLKRDEKTGHSKGFCFICYEDWRSTVLAVDNMNGAEVFHRKLKVDHARTYFKLVKSGEELERPLLLRQLLASETNEQKHHSDTPKEKKRKKKKGSPVNEEGDSRRKRRRYSADVSPPYTRDQVDSYEGSTGQHDARREEHTSSSVSLRETQEGQEAIRKNLLTPPVALHSQQQTAHEATGSKQKSERELYELTYRYGITSKQESNEHERFLRKYQKMKQLEREQTRK